MSEIDRMIDDGCPHVGTCDDIADDPTESQIFIVHSAEERRKPMRITEEQYWDIFHFGERVGLLLGGIRNYKRTGHPIDLDFVLGLEPEIADMLAKVRDIPDAKANC